jgi:formamidopyrimidine-DNA glycosylase
MPELPEVETVRRTLAPRLVGRRVVDVRVHDARLRTPLRQAVLRRRLVGRSVVALGRRAKYLVAEVEAGWALVLHLGMSGRLRVLPAGAPAEPHTHVRLRLDDGNELRFRDQRRFGMLFVVQSARLAAHPRFRNLGPEPLSPEFSAADLARAARGSQRPIKNFIMDASIVVGVGNIYASEALYRAGIHPETPAGRLSAARWQRLHAAVQATLNDALQQGGTTLNDFQDADGQEGMFQVRLGVYGREAEPCERCRRRIRRIVQAGRSTFYCPGCQRLSPASRARGASKRRRVLEARPRRRKVAERAGAPGVETTRRAARPGSTAGARTRRP